MTRTDRRRFPVLLAAIAAGNHPGTNVHPPPPPPPPPDFSGAALGAAAMTRAIATLALAGTALGLLFSTAEAQEAETLVSNIGKIGSDTHSAIVDGVLLVAQGFTVGDQRRRIRHLDRAPIQGWEISFRNTSANCDISAVVRRRRLRLIRFMERNRWLRSTLTNPSGTSKHTASTFNAPAATELDAGTTYLVHGRLRHGAVEIARLENDGPRT